MKSILCRNSFVLLAVFTLSGTGIIRGGETFPKPVSVIDRGFLDTQTKPCDDFYQYACGGWIAHTPIPDDKSQWSRGFAEVADRNEKTLKFILEGYAKAKPAPADAEIKKLGDFYTSCIDEARVERDSLKALREKLALVAKIDDGESLARAVAGLHLEGINVLFGFGSMQDFGDSNQVIGGADQAGLTLPDRDYYLKNEGKMPEIRKLYRDYLAKMGKLLGTPVKTAGKNAETVFQIETSLAKASLPLVDRRDPSKLYHRLERSGLKKLAPHFPWDVYFQALGYEKITAINVLVPDFFKGLDEILVKPDFAAIRTYLSWHLLHELVPTLGKRFVDEGFRFRSAAFTGEKKLRVRWKRCVAGVEEGMGQPLGHAFVNRTFGEQGKTEAREMIGRIENSFEAILKDAPWIDNSTREIALKKLKSVVNQIGYPDKWRDFSGLTVVRDSYLKNMVAANTFNNRYDLNKIGKPADRTEWEMTPQTVNAYYSPENNKMVFPAGILQPPFFNKAFPRAVNYGGIGMVMGHELTHGFDDEGRQYDEKGNLKNWWSKEMEKEFNARAECLVKQYSAFVPIDSLHLNGKLTLGENIADQGGIRIAYAAMGPTSVPEEKKPDEFNDRQRFFLGFAQSWCTKQRPEMARMRVATDAHSPAKFRVNAPLSNFPTFAETFGCKATDAMVNPKPCVVW